jgi:23S rRNA pseudouridine1911/1915/1917 synthase
MLPQTESIIHIIITAKEAGFRVDKVLAKHESIGSLSRSRIKKYHSEGLLLVNDQLLPLKYKVLQGDQITITIPAASELKVVAEDIPLDILFEDEYIIVINKQAGIVVHPSPGHNHSTLVHGLLYHCKDLSGIGGVLRPGIVHRLDKDTSGVIIVAKNDRAHRFLQEQFKQRRTEKVYLTLVDGAPPTPSGRIEAPIGRDTTHRQRMKVVPPGKGREAVTVYHTLERFREHTLLAAHPLTGRTHQIRVHLAFLGCPVVGDSVYGRRRPTLPLARHFLHAYRLTITLPGEKAPRTFEAPLPPELQAALEEARSR